MMRSFFLFSMLALVSAACASSDPEPVPVAHEAVCIENRETLLALPFDAFDQDMEGGWRSVQAKPGCALAAADLIRDYHAALRERGEPVILDTEQGSFVYSKTGVIPLLYWHEGQVRAMSGQTEAAIMLFHLSIKPEEESLFGWNHYVRATIAFLEQDFEALETERDLLATQDMRGLNTRAVDGLIACFYKPYSEAYSGMCRPAD